MIKYGACFENNSFCLFHEYKAWEMKKAGLVATKLLLKVWRGHTMILSIALLNALKTN